MEKLQDPGLSVPGIDNLRTVVRCCDKRVRAEGVKARIEIRSTVVGKSLRLHEGVKDSTIQVADVLRSERKYQFWCTDTDYIFRSVIVRHAQSLSDKLSWGLVHRRLIVQVPCQKPPPDCLDLFQLSRFLFSHIFI